MTSEDRAAPATLADVARRAGVSLATASRALNGSADRRVGEPLREQVVQAAAALDYSPNAQAQAVVRGRTATVGLVVHDVSDPYFSTIAAGVIDAATARGLLVTVTSTQHDPTVELHHVELLRRFRARAIVLAGSRTDDQRAMADVRAALRAFARGGGRVASIGQDVLGVDTLVVQNRESAAELAAALHSQGHRRFALLAGPPGHLTARDRVAGVRNALAGLGAEPEPGDIVHSAFTHEGGRSAVQELLARHGARPTVDCVVAANDVMALGALSALRAAGARVPDDIGVAGFDDIATLRDVVPPLSTVRLPLFEMGEAAVALALDDATPTERSTVRGEVVLRQSSMRRTERSRQ